MRSCLERSADTWAERARLLERLDVSFRARAEANLSERAQQRGFRSNDIGLGTDAVEQGSAQTEGRAAEEERRFEIR